ncbi:hypothetical protein D3C80_2000230 [compost metagenome]
MTNSCHKAAQIQEHPIDRVEQLSELILLSYFITVTSEVPFRDLRGQEHGLAQGR